jgi:hypothetical protein
MRLTQAVNLLDRFKSRKVYIFSRHDLGVIFQEEDDTLSSTIKRLTKEKFLEKVANGLYAAKGVNNGDGILLYKIAAHLRPRDINYLSNESVLSNLSIISQQMLDQITVMTTGRSGKFVTPFGAVEFTHSKRDPVKILKSTVKPDGMPIRFADKHIALRDLKRIGRNIDMVDMEEFHEQV